MISTHNRTPFVNIHNGVRQHTIVRLISGSPHSGTSSRVMTYSPPACSPFVCPVVDQRCVCSSWSLCPLWFSVEVAEVVDGRVHPVRWPRAPFAWDGV